MLQLSDNIFNKIQKGDLKAFEEVFKSLYPPLCNYAYRFIKDKDLVEEYVQEIFCKLWDNREQLSIMSSLKSYLFKSIHNRCIRHIQHQDIERKYQEQMVYQTNSSVNPQEILENQELSLLLSKTLDKLPIRCQHIFKLNRYEGLKYKEIAEKLSISIKTVEANMGKALKAFRSSLESYHITE